MHLRAPYYPQGFAFPLAPPPPEMVAIEIGREAATLVMLLGFAMLALAPACHRLSRMSRPSLIEADSRLSSGQWRPFCATAPRVRVTASDPARAAVLAAPLDAAIAGPHRSSDSTFKLVVRVRLDGRER